MERLPALDRCAESCGDVVLTPENLSGEVGDLIPRQDGIAVGWHTVLVREDRDVAIGAQLRPVGKEMAYLAALRVELSIERGERVVVKELALAHHQLVVEDDHQIGCVERHWLGYLFCGRHRVGRREPTRKLQVTSDMKLGDKLYCTW